MWAARTKRKESSGESLNGFADLHRLEILQRVLSFFKRVQRQGGVVLGFPASCCRNAHLLLADGRSRAG